jgi:hypothetical protein
MRRQQMKRGRKRRDGEAAWFARGKTRSSAVLLSGLLLGLATLAGCLGEPEVEDRWTLLEILAVNPPADAVHSSDQPLDLTITSRITYRNILTGFLVAEVRYSDVLPPASVNLDPEEHTEAVALDVDRILANSVTAGRASKVITGFDHLMQDVEFTFTAQVPAGMFAGSPDSVSQRGMYLVVYVGEGEEIRRPGQPDSLVVVPFVSTEYEILHTGLELDIIPPGTVPPAKALPSGKAGS